MSNDRHDESQSSNQRKNHNPKIALILSLLFAGLGQLYNKRYVKGIAFIILELAFIVTFKDFIHLGLWGISTLGTIPGTDHSIFLLVYGLVSIILLAFVITFYVFNVRDAYKQAQLIKKGWEAPTFKESVKEGYDKSFPYLLTAPGLVLVIFTVVFPLMFAISLAFTNYDLYNSPPRNLVEWVGFQNFVNLVTVPLWRSTFISVFSWTIIWTLVATSLQIALGLFLAVLVNDARIKFKKTIRTILILPWAVPGFVSILIFAAMFNDQFGAINRDIMEPLFGVSLPWLTDPFYTRIVLIMIQTWLGYPFIFALFSGVLQSISKDWYEAAEVDGASRWQKFRNITLPHVLFATAPLLIIQYTTNFNNFNIIYLFNQGGPAVRGQSAGGTDILISWVYSLTFETSNYSMAAAISLIIGLMVSIFAIFQFRKTSSFKEEGKR
ncbi:carbohydrate ABC transporter permease [Alkalihalobacillus hemicellulosilyticus]|uniref:Maltose/maltodextrin transport system permease protein n=1 Tax=Halalkalibacter hemicellulosilyticusJCM 9152 TaxID=1236971 RepID=W4QMS0_9BACI|nr:sugar ABC transporter permease [Halalkalibacter hemicellulosilyticus]GAE32923.1 maltose/maltodextrin ABC transporter [Halalkalibacter hemicellulosilyticusJCM 9152]